MILERTRGRKRRSEWYKNNKKKKDMMIFRGKEKINQVGK